MRHDPFVVRTEHPSLDAILEEHRAEIDTEYTGYRNHCLSVYNLVRVAVELDERQDEAVAIAAAHHDIALWTDDRIDYLDPSRDHALAWLEREGRAELSGVVSEMIMYHHKITTGAFARMDPLALAFRNADWSAFTYGLIPFDRFTAPRKAIAKAFPDAGFHAFLTRRTLRHLRSGGIANPLPMMKW